MVLRFSPIDSLAGAPLKQLLSGAPAESAYVGEAEHGINISFEPLLAPLVPGVAGPEASIVGEVEVWLRPTPAFYDAIAGNLAR